MSIKDINIPATVNSDALERDLEQRSNKESIKGLDIPLQSEYTGLSTPQKSQYEVEDFESYFDGTIDPVYGDIVEQRAQNQTNLDQLANGVVKGLGLAATTFATTFTSLPYGIVSGIAAGDFSKVYDNPISRKFDEFSKTMEEIFPNYYTNAEQNAGALSKDNIFTMNFLADKLLKNAGFTVGAIYSGSLVSKALSPAIMKGIRGLAKIGSKGSYADDIAAVTKLAKSYTNQGLSEAQAFTRAMGEAGQAIKIGNATNMAATNLIAAGTEATIEALGTKNEIEAKLGGQLKKQLDNGKITEQEYKARLAEAGKLAAAGGNVDYIANLFILSASNSIQFGRILQGNNVARKNVINEIRREGGQYVAQVPSRFKRATSRIGAFTGSMITEASEEGSQFVSQKASEEFYSKKFSGEGKGVLMDAFNATLHGFEQTFGTKEGVESMLLGALTGLGSGVVTGETRRQLAEIKNKDQRTRKLVDDANALTKNAFLKGKPNVDNAVRSAVLQGEMDKAVAENDVYKFKNLQNDLFKSFVLSRIKMGKIESLKDEINDFANLPQEEFNKLFGIDESVSTKTKEQYIDMLNKEVDNMAKLHSNLELRFPTMSEGGREMLFDYAYNIENSGKRIDALSNEIDVETLGAVQNYLDNKNPETKKELDSVIEKNSVNYISKGNELQTLVDDYVKLSERRNEFADLYQNGLKNPENLEKTVNKFTEQEVEAAKKAEASKFDDGSMVIDKETGAYAGKLLKSDGKFKLYSNVIKAEPIEVDPGSDEFLAKYDVLNPSENSDNVTERVYIDRNTGEEAIVSDNKEVENAFYIKKGNRVLERVPKEVLDREYVYMPRKDTKRKLYQEKNPSDGVAPKQFSVFKDKGNKYKIRRNVPFKDGSRRYVWEDISKQELDDNYTFVKDYERAQKETQVRTETLEELVSRTETQVKELEEHIAGLEPIHFLRKELSELQEKISKNDKRRTNKSAKEILKRIDELNKTIEEANKYVYDAEQDLQKLRNKREYLYNRLAEIEESDIEDVKPIKDDITEVEDKINENVSLIEYFREGIRKLKRLINNLLEAFHLGKIYNIGNEEKILNEYAKEVKQRVQDLPNANKVYGKQMAFAIAKVKKYIRDKEKDVESSKAQVPVIGAKISNAQKQVESLIKEEAELYERLFNLEEELTLYESKVKLLNLASPAEISAIPKTMKGVKGADVQSINMRTDGEIDDAYDGFARNPETINFKGLGGRHIEEDGSYTDDPNQRAYYRFTERNDLNSGKFRIRFGYKGAKQLFPKYKDPIDKPVIYAFIIDQDGNNVNEFGEPTENRDEFIFTTLLTSEATHLFYQPKDMSKSEYANYVKQLKNHHLKVRKEIIDRLDKEETVETDIIGKSAGIPITFNKKFGEFDNVRLQDSGISMADLDIKVSTTGQVVFNNGSINPRRPGFIAAHDNKTGNTLPVNTRQLQESEVNMLVKLWKKFINESKTATVGGKLIVDSGGASTLYNKVGDRVRPITDRNSKDLSMFDIMRRFVFWSDNNLKVSALKEAKEDRSKIPEIVSDANNLINKDPKSKAAFYWVQEVERTPGGILRLGNFTEGPNKGKPRQIRPFVLDPSTNTYVENPAFEPALRDFLSEQYINVDSIDINDDRGFVPIKGIYQDKDGNYYANPDTTYEDKGGYKKWLLDNDMLTTSVIPRGETTKGTENDMQFQSVYAIADLDSIIGEDSPNFTRESAKKSEKKRATKASGSLSGTLDPSKRINAPDVADLMEAEAYESAEASGAFHGLDPNKRLPVSDARDLMEAQAYESKEEEPSKEETQAALRKAEREQATREKEDKEPSGGKLTNDDIEGVDDNTPSTDASNLFRPAQPTVQERIEIDKALAWLNKAFGGRIRTAVVERLIASENWGSYHNALITIYRNAGVGTEYHEAFHAVSDLFLTTKERKALYDEYRKLNKVSLSDNAVEEALAEDFASYMAGEKISYFKSPKQKGLFRSIVEAIKTFLFGKNANQIQNVFDKINNGYYAKAEFADQGSGMTNYRSAIGDMTVKDTKDVMDGVNAYFFRYIFSNKDRTATLFDKTKNADTVTEAYNHARKSIGSIYNSKYDLYDEYVQRYEKTGSKFDFAIKEELKRQLNVLRPAVTDNWVNVLELHKDHLQKYNLELDYTTWNKDIPEHQRQRDSGQTWAFESLKFSSKINANKNIKLLLGSIPLVEAVVDNKGNEILQGVTNDLGLATNMDYGRFFNSLINKLSNTTNWNDMYNRLDELSTDVPSVKVLLKRLGGNRIENLSTNEFTLRSQFQQTMAKNENVFTMDMVEGNETTIINANQNSFNKRKIREWESEAGRQASGTKYYKSQRGTLIYRESAFKDFGRPDSFEKALKFLKILGIEFSNPDRIDNNPLLKKDLISRAAGMYSQIIKGDQVFIYNDKKGGNSYQNLEVLSTIERKTTVNNVESSLYNLDGNLIYGQSLNSYLSLAINEMNNVANENVDVLFERMPHLLGVQNSVVLNKLLDGEMSNIELTTHLGSKIRDFNAESREFKKLSPTDRLRVAFNRVFDGDYAFLRPADNAQERFIKFGTFFTGNKINNLDHIETFVNYLVAEINEGKALEKKPWLNLNRNGNRGIVLDMINFVDKELYKDLTNLKTTIDTYLDNADNRLKIENAIIRYLDKQVTNNKKLFEKYKLVEKIDDSTYLNNGLNRLGREINERQYTAGVEYFTVNNTIANIEQIKLFIGNPRFYKSVEDQFKRHSGLVGTKKISITDDYMNEWIKKTDILSQMKQNYGYNQPVITTAVIRDIESVSKYFEEYKNLLGPEKAKAYGKMEESDAQGFIHFDEYRRMLIRSGEWSYGKGSLEEAYQSEIGREYYKDPATGQRTFKIDKNRVRDVVFTPLKPQHFGPLAEDGFIPGFYKLSLVPILPTVSSRYTNLKKLKNQMGSQNVGIVVFASGNKVGTKTMDDGTVQPAYDKDTGEFLFGKDNKMITQDTFYKYWGIQVEMGNKPKKSVIWGTQMAKQITNGLVNAGKHVAMRFMIDGKMSDKTAEATEEIHNKYLYLNKKRVDLGYQELKEKLGYSEEGDISAEATDKIVEALTEEAISREMPDNIIEGINYISTHGIDVLPSRKKLEQILMAMADKAVISQKTFGNAAVQVSSSFMEKNNIREVTLHNGDKALVSSDLDFYKLNYKGKEVQSVESMQVLLPAKYKGIADVGKIKDKRLLSAIGFRIPTQGLNSIESIEIAGFLPESFGDAIVLPSEIVAKTGSDFDIDKLNIFLANFYYNRNDKPVYIDSKMTYKDYLKDISAQEKLDNRELTETQFEKAKVENELKEVMHSIITSPDNVEQLLTPNTTATLKEDSRYITYLEAQRDGKFTGTFAEYKEFIRNTKEPITYNNLVETEFILNTAEQFLGANQAVGITALYSTFHIMAQQNAVGVRSEIPSGKVDENGPITGTPTVINLAHNRDENENISLGGLKDANDKESIVDLFNMWINAAVDAATDPFMFKLNATPETLNSILYLTMAGVPTRTVSLFMNQPIIKDYLENTKIYMSLTGKTSEMTIGDKPVRSKKQIRDYVLAKYGSTNVDGFKNVEPISDKELVEGIVSPNKNKELQRQILYDYLRYEETARKISDAIQATTYDTRGAGKSMSEREYKILLSNAAMDEGLILNFDKVLTDGFISPYYDNVSKFGDIFKTYMPHLNNPYFTRNFTNFAKKYINSSQGYIKDDVVKVLDKYKDDFFTYLAMNEIPTGDAAVLKNEIDRLFLGSNSMAHRTVDMKKKYPGNVLLNNLFPIFSANTKDINNIKMYMTRLDNLESNQLTKDWENMFNGSPEEQLYAYDLLQFIILQSGLQNSPLNFVNLAPAEQYIRFMEPVLQSINSQNSNYADFEEQFQVHNQKDRTIVPVGRSVENFSMYLKRTGAFPNYEYKLADADTKQLLNIKEAPIKDPKNNSTLHKYGLTTIQGLTRQQESTNKTSKESRDEGNQKNESENPIC